MLCKTLVNDGWFISSFLWCDGMEVNCVFLLVSDKTRIK